MSKSIKKKLFKHSKKYPELTPWIKSIINHYWWCCGTCARDVELLREKWCSILNHVLNKHKWDRNRQFTSCEHGKISQTHAKDVQWLVHGSPAHTCLQSIVMDKTILNDLPYLVEYNHTGMLEVYHALMLKYVPKQEHFQLYGMIARTQLAVLEHNYNCNRSQMKTKSGKPRYKYPYSKVTQNWVAKPIMEKKENSYLYDMLKDVYIAASKNISLELPITLDIPKNIAPTPRPSVESLISCRSRFAE